MKVVGKVGLNSGVVGGVRQTELAASNCRLAGRDSLRCAGKQYKGERQRAPCPQITS